MVRFVLVTLMSSLTFRLELNSAILDFALVEVRKNTIFYNLVPENSNGAFSVNYAESVA